MNIENTNGQQPNPGDGAAPTTTAANPTAETGTDPTKASGQGEGGDNAAVTGDANKGDTKDPKDAATDDAVPKTYATFDLPEGFVLEGERAQTANDFFKAHKFTQAQAQEAVNLFTKLASEDAGALQTALQTAQEQAREQQREAWATQAKAELGDKYDETLAFATTAVKAVNDPKLTEAFNEHGWGNHPALIRAFATFGRVMRDSTIEGIGDAGGAGKEATLESRMYPGMKK